jgi:hypothetical protein
MLRTDPSAAVLRARSATASSALPGTVGLLTGSIHSSLRSTTQAACRTVCCRQDACGRTTPLSCSTRSCRKARQGRRRQRCATQGLRLAASTARHVGCSWSQPGQARCAARRACFKRDCAWLSGRAAHKVRRPVRVLHDAGSGPDRALMLRPLRRRITYHMRSLPRQATRGSHRCSRAAARWQQRLWLMA